MPTGPTGSSPPRPARVGWLDLSSGASGDMLLGAVSGALAGTGQRADVIADAVDALGLPVRLDVTVTRRAGIAATRVHVTTNDVISSGGTTHPDGLQRIGAPGGEHLRRTWADIRLLLAGAPLAATVRERALATFATLAEAEATVHGIRADDVHFHEVGALDALADVVGVCAGLDALGLDQLVASPMALGGGSARTGHGVLPIPGPAVLELLRASGMPAHGGPVDLELCTPTGAALVATHVGAYGQLPAMRVESVGVGAGQRDIPGRPNVVRLVVGTAPPAGMSAHGASEREQSVSAYAAARIPPATDELLVETNVDDLDPRAWPEILAALLAVGASDAWLTPILMKKGRPAHTLSVLVAPARADPVRQMIFFHTPTLGLRETPVHKRALDRTFRPVNVSGETIAVKIGMLPDGQVVTVQPEWDDVRRAAVRLDRPTRWVLAAAASLASETSWAPDTDRTYFTHPGQGTDDDKVEPGMQS
ncbi:nickel pincer cofactor biosynthesis protein LarC [Frankia sp. Cr1]|uniref:nickel pincer cofactor biosynthesis protein LarC n=1 Tax=Frankia sp. Cr1 TaxID=3073931 RepID=UPI002AD337AF|nr:nickel pincer cofactor biosynthesis protein LarC [Frankia sp. Cr1]